MCEPDMESAFNADLARQLAANCGAAVDRASREHRDVTLEVHWDPAAMKAVVSACHVRGSRVATELIGVGTAAADIEALVSGLSRRAMRMWLRANPSAGGPKGIAPDEEDDDIPF